MGTGVLPKAHVSLTPRGLGMLLDESAGLKSPKDALKKQLRLPLKILLRRRRLKAGISGDPKWAGRAQVTFRGELGRNFFPDFEGGGGHRSGRENSLPIARVSGLLVKEEENLQYPAHYCPDSGNQALEDVVQVDAEYSITSIETPP